MAYGFLPHSLCSGTVLTTIVLGDCPDHHRARRLFRPLSCSGLSRSPSCSGTVPTTLVLVLGTVSTVLVLGDCPDYGYSRGFVVFPMLRSGTAPTTLRPLLGDCSHRLHVICTHIQLRGILFFSQLDLATRLIPHLQASSGTTSVRCTCRCSSYRLYDDWILNFTGNSFLDPSTTCLRHLLPGSGTKWAHFTLW